MMSRPDFMEKQVLFIESDSSRKLKFKNSNLALVDESGKILLQHSCHKIFLVFIYGDCSITSVLIKNFKRFAISVVFLNYNLTPYFSISPIAKGNFLLRQKQYTCSFELDLAKYIVKNKISNQLFLMRSLRYKTENERKSIERVVYFLNEIDQIENSKDLLGIEGNVSKEFFKTYFKNLPFKKRIPRCKMDIINLLFDIGYYYLFNFIEANLEIYGFDSYKGFYHTLFFQRKSLVCDLMEPFRCIVDRRIRKSYNLKQINENEFGFKNGQCYIKKGFNKKYSRLFLKEILLYKEEIFLYVQKYYRSFIKEKQIEEFHRFSLGDNK